MKTILITVFFRILFLDLQTDLVTYLTERLNKFNPEAGKAYSYYTTCYENLLVNSEQLLSIFSQLDSVAARGHFCRWGK